MRSKISTPTLISIVLTSLLSGNVSANDDPEILYNSARNQLGLIMYCVGRGHTSAEAVGKYHRILATLPKPSDTANADKFEYEGSLGNNYDGISSVSIETIAQGMGITVAERCAQLEALTKQ
ncbi:hypothetical protein [Agrobacterium fabrum]|uniref:hypothetical protein n=1 Tax=Agrobacterium fabrum TaxID=1176649 RepID=UPI003BA2B198